MPLQKFLHCFLIVTALFLFNSCGRKTSGLEVKCDEKGAEVFLDGTRVGTCPVITNPKTGRHTLAIRKQVDPDTYYYYEDTIIVQDGTPQKVKAILSLRFTTEAAKKIFQDFVFVKGGCFQMGDIFGEKYDMERPVHEVCIDDFFMGKYEVTQDLWQKVTGENPSSEVFSKLPVDNVSWNDIQKFNKKLSSMTGTDYRLPTEAEWEYAARSGGKRERWAGTNDKNELSEYAWVGKDAGMHFVGLKKPNGLGLYDMTGNVWERVQDAWSRYEATKQYNPRGAETLAEAKYHTINRGGDNFGRSGRNFAMRDRGVGFRLAISATKAN